MLDFQATCCDASESEGFAREFVVNNTDRHDIGHLYEDASAQRASKRMRVCRVHGGQACRLDETAEILITGMSCQPVSGQRVGRYSTPIENHPEFRSHTEVLHIIRSRKSLRAGAIEEVMGFRHGSAEAGGMGASPLQNFLNELTKIKRFEFRVLELDSWCFIKFSRKRLPIDNVHPVWFAEYRSDQCQLSYLVYNSRNM